MKFINKAFVFIIVGLFIGNIMPYIRANDFNKNMESNQKEWTWIFYDDADSYNMGDPMDPPFEYGMYSIPNTIYSGENLNVIVLQDTFFKPAKLWYIGENKTKTLLQDMSEINMGDDQTLSDLILYAKNNFPADRYLLSIYSHGFGWQGACGDNLNMDFLTMHEMQEALLKAGGVDIICFTAPCNMAAIESVYELRDCTDVYIGSEESSMYLYWMNSMENIRNLLDYNFELSSIEIGMEIVIFIEKDHIGDEMITMSAVRTDEIEELVFTIDSMAKYFIENPNLFKILRSIYPEIDRFGAGEFIDIYDFCRLMNNSIINEDLSLIFQNMMNSLESSVIAEYHGTFHSNAHGLTIFLPNFLFKYFSVWWYGHPLLNLDIAQNTMWDEFIKNYLIRKYF